MIPSCSPTARGRSERFFGTVQGRLPQELAHGGGEPLSGESFRPRTDRRFGVAARSAGSAFVPLGHVGVDDMLCLEEERTVARDNCVATAASGTGSILLKTCRLKNPRFGLRRAWTARERNMVTLTEIVMINRR